MQPATPKQKRELREQIEALLLLEITETPGITAKELITKFSKLNEDYIYRALWDLHKIDYIVAYDDLLFSKFCEGCLE